MRKTALQIALAGFIATFVLGGVALANFTAGTSLTIDHSPHGAVHAGTKIDFHGKLSSGRHFCVNNEHITLFRVKKGPDAAVGGDRTSENGKYSIKEKVNKDGSYYARFKGHASGVHPNRKVCLGSRSANEPVNVH